MDDALCSEKSVSSEPLLCTVNSQVQNTISIADRGLAFGDGVFETILLRDGKLPFLSAHIERLSLGLKKLQINLKLDCLHQQIENMINVSNSRKINNGIVKIIVSRGNGRGYAPLNDIEPNIIIAVYPLADWSKEQQQGVSVVVCEYRLPLQYQLAGIKHLNRIDNVMASLEVQSRGATEGLLFDLQNNLVEGISRNVFIVTDNQLKTPSLDSVGVKGVMRDMIIGTLASSINCSVTEEPLELSKIKSADEIFLCNSVTGIWPVVAVDDDEYPIGPVTKNLQNALEAHLNSGRAG